MCEGGSSLNRPTDALVIVQRADAARLRALERHRRLVSIAEEEELVLAAVAVMKVEVAVAVVVVQALVATLGLDTRRWRRLLEVELMDADKGRAAFEKLLRCGSTCLGPSSSLGQHAC